MAVKENLVPFPKKKNKKDLWQSVFLYLLLALVGLFFYFQLTNPGSSPQKIQLTQALEDVQNHKVKKIIVKDTQLELIYKDGRRTESKKERGVSIFTLLTQAGIKEPQRTVEIEVANIDSWGVWIGLFSNLLPLIIMIAFLIFLSREGRRAASSVFSFGKSTARLFNKDQPRVTFDDAAGVDEAKQELFEIVDFLKNPQKYTRLGARIPKGVLLLGPAGTGKTLLARAVAGEANVPFFSIAGSEFMEMLVGVGASRVRDLFATAKKHAPSIIFIDEIESVGRHRGTGFTGAHGEQEQTLNQILVEMDGFSPRDRIVVIGASNRPDLLDPALTRPGRFDRRIILQLPDIEGRIGILKIHMKGKPFAEDVDVRQLAERTVGFSGADIENMLNEAAIAAARNNRDQITKEDLEEAAMKIKLGPERKRLQSEEDKKLTAYHEAGHAIVANKLPHMDPVHRVSIVARGLALGFTLIPPKIDRYHMTKTRLLEMITSLMGGRAAEKMACGEQTVGAANDLEKATKLAYEMVTQYGMSELGFYNWHFSDLEEGWSPVSLRPRIEISDALKSQIDQEVKRILDQAFQEAWRILSEQRSALDRVAQELMDKESLSGDEFRALLENKE